MAPTRDADETEPGQAAADLVREELRTALDRHDRETERALDDYEEDRESVITEVHVNLAHPKTTTPPTRAPMSLRPGLPAPLARVLGWFPPHWRPWLLLGFLLLVAGGAWQAGLIGGLVAAMIKVFGV